MSIRPVHCIRILLLAAALAVPAAADIVFVDASAIGAADGSSWADAFPDLGDALAAASPGDQVWVAAGLYRPPLPGRGDPRAATFALPADVELYGGFAGGETALPQRDPALNVTTLSGDLGAPGDAADNAYHVLTAGVGGGRLDGFVVRDGRADGALSADRQGALLLANTSSLLVVGCTFTGGHATLWGGAVMSANGHEQLVACRFEGNEANDGGAVFLANAQGATFTSCVFEDNHGIGATPEGGALVVSSGFGASSAAIVACRFSGNSSGQGGAVVARGQGHPGDVLRIERSLFEQNTAIHGGALMLSNAGTVVLGDSTFAGNSVSNVGGAIVLFSSNPHISRCRFLGNSTPHRGGAIAATLNTFLSFGSTPRITDSIFLGNTANEGGALFANGLGATDLVLSGCTLAGNTATLTGGGVHAEPYTNGSPQLLVRNTILWDNADAGGVDESAQLHLEQTVAFVDSSDVSGWTGGMGGSGNLDADPLFADLDGPDDLLGTPDDDPRLLAGSPCIDAGDASLLVADGADADCDGDLLEVQPLDVHGHVRVADGGGGLQVDIGASESGSDLPADVWADLGGGTAGVAGVPSLAVFGTLCGGHAFRVELTQGPPNTLGFFWIAVASAPLPVFGGTLHAFPPVAQFLVPTDGAGARTSLTTWPEGVPAGITFTFQYILADPSVVFGLTLSNGVAGSTP